MEISCRQILIGQRKRKMIKVEYLEDSDEKIGTCASCGKNDYDDPLMIRVKIRRKVDGGYGYTGINFCLCDECRTIMYKTI